MASLRYETLRGKGLETNAVLPQPGHLISNIPFWIVPITSSSLKSLYMQKKDTASTNVFSYGRLETEKEEEKSAFLGYKSFVVSSLGNANNVSVATSSAASIAIFIASFSLGALKIRTVS
jgi:hypothetical protein